MESVNEVEMVGPYFVSNRVCRTVLVANQRIAQLNHKHKTFDVSIELYPVFSRVNSNQKGLETNC